MAAKPKSRAKEAPPAQEKTVTARDRRISLMKAIEAKRGGRLLICYITSTRPGFELPLDRALNFRSPTM
jgi:hypothetical protein